MYKVSEIISVNLSHITIFILRIKPKNFHKTTINKISIKTNIKTEINKNGPKKTTTFKE